MALKVLLLRNKLDSRKKKLDELREKEQEFEKREAELEAAIEEMTEETLTAVGVFFCWLSGFLYSHLL